MKTFFRKLSLLSSALFVSGHVLAAPQTFLFEGQIAKPDGTPLAESSVQFKIQVRSFGAENCLMYEETRTLDLSNSSGSFSIALNDAAAVRTDSTGLSFSQVFSNGRSFSFTAGYCQTGTSYNPNSADGRRVVASFKSATMSAFETMPTINLASAPFAIESEQVGGFNADHLLRVENSSSAISALTGAEYTELGRVLNGTTAQYERSGKLNGLTLPTFTIGQVLSWNGTTWAAAAQSDPTVQSFARAAVADCGPGQVMTKSSGILTCTAAPIPTFPNGSAAAPSIAVGPGASTGFYSSATGEVGISLSGTQSGKFSSAGLQLETAGFPTAFGYELKTPNGLSFVGLDNMLNRFVIKNQNPVPISVVMSSTEVFRIDAAGKVGIGSTSPRGALTVDSGAIVGADYSAGNSTSVDFSHGNLQYTTADCGAFTLNNMKNGSTYKLAVMGPNGGTCSFTAYSGSGTIGPLTVYIAIGYSAAATGKYSQFTFDVVGGRVMVTPVIMQLQP